MISNSLNGHAKMQFRITELAVNDSTDPSQWRRIFFAAALVCVMTGCQQVGYRPESLPAHLTARPTIDVNSLDLSRLATTDFDNSKIFPGDKLNVTVVTGTETRQPVPWEVSVTQDGAAEVPLIGPVQVVGSDVRQAQQLFRNASIQRGIFRQPSISVSLAERQTNRVSVMGAVENPGTYELPRAGSDLLNAIVSAGGFTNEADRLVEVRLPTQVIPGSPANNSPYPSGAAAEVAQTSYGTPVSPSQTIPAKTVQVDLVSATTTGQPQGYGLLDGSIVMVKKQPPRHIHVIGLVNKSNRFELPPGENVRFLDAIAMAQGTKLSLADRAFIIRQVQGASEPIVIDCSIRGAKENPTQNLLLTDGDVVSVEETPFTFVFGTVKDLVRVGLSSRVTF